MTDTEKWRILGARADAWLEVLAVAGLARVETDVEIDWAEEPGTIITPTDRAVPHQTAAPSLVVGRSRIESVDDAGVPLGVGDPAILLDAVPACGCDACDHGSEPDLRELDECVLAVVIGHDGPLRGGSGWGLVSANGEPPHSTAG